MPEEVLGQRTFKEVIPLSAQRVRDYFRALDMEGQIIELKDTIATASEAARALNTHTNMIAKTMAFRLKDRDILVLLSGDARIDNKKYRHTFGAKAKFIDPDELEEVTGHKMGGVCPFGLPAPLDIYLDESLKNHPYCYPAAGDIYHAIRLTPQRIMELTGAGWVDISLM